MHASVIGKKGKLAALFAAFAVILSGAISPLMPANAAPGNPANVETWSELEAAINSGASDITITKDLVAEGGQTLTITRPVTIQGGATIYRDSQASSYEPMFTVSGNGNLTLAGNIKLSGKTATCSSGEQLTLEQVAQTEERPKPVTEEIWFKSDSGYLNWGRTNAQVNLDSVQAPFNVGAGGKLWTTYLGIDRYMVARDSDYAFLPESSDHHYVELRDGNGDVATSVIKGETYVLFDTLHNEYVTNGLVPPGTADISSALKFTAELQDEPETETVTVWVIDGVTYTNQGEAEAALATYNANHSGGCTPDSTCGSPVNGTQFKGARGAEKGFFVQVNGGTFNLTGNAELRDLITDATVTYAAPVVSKGGTVNITGGKITHNSVGYSANNADSGLRADRIGREAQNGWGEIGKIADYANTETAGAIILTEGSAGTISGGELSGNRADTGAIVVQGKPDRDRSGGENRNVENGNATASTLAISGGAIDNNVGVHHAGGIYVFNGALVEMSNGSITNNFAWNKGGAVWVSEESYASSNPKKTPSHLPVGDASFILKGGTLSGNMAVNRGGAINVMSDRVALLGGMITNNYSRVLGGAVYVEGDASDRLYQLFIAKGCITDNHAVPASNNATSAPLYRTLNRAGGCDFSNEMNGATAGDVSDHKDYNNYYGNGGGVWLCSFGGNTTFAVPNTEVTLWDNNASAKGQDLVVRPLRGGATNGFSFLDLGTQKFADEDRAGVVYSNETVQGRVFSGPIHATAETTGTCSADGVQITNNVASNGGGIAANGNVVFGTRAEIAQAFTSLKLTKMWSSELAQKPVTLSLSAKIDEDTIVPLTGYEVTLDGTPDTPTENDAIWESEAWVAEMGMPLSVTDGDKVYPLFTFDDNGTILDPTKITDLLQIAKKVQSGELTKADAKVVEFVVVETIGGVEQKNVVNLGTTLDNLQYLGTDETDLKDMNGHVVGELDTYKVGMDFSYTIGNDIKPAVEKYVNKDVDAHLVEFDKVVTYDILAYVPLNADSLEINDKLVDSLEFADVNGKATTAASDSVSAIVAKAVNDHTAVTGTVATDNGTPLDADAVPTISGKNLKVEIADATAYRGQWIQVTFTAKYTDAAIKAAKVSPAADNADVADNGTVISSIATHDGTANTASYKIEVDNKWSSDYTSNTVTHDAETTELTVEKKWNVNGSTAWPTEVPSVTFGVYSVKSGSETLVKEVEVNAQNPSVTVTGLPKLKDTTYVAREIMVGSQAVSNGTTDAGIVRLGDLLEFIAKTVKTTVSDLDVFTTTNETAQVEKYVNDKVHADLEGFDEVFEYSVMAYVPEGATKAVITDKLIDQLEFVNADPGKVLSSVIVYKDNTHVGDGSGVGVDQLRVAGKVAANERPGSPVEVNGKTVTLTLGEDFLNEVRDTDLAGSESKGFWVKMSFKAKIAEGVYEDVAAKIASGDDSTNAGLGWEKVTNDGSVTNGADVQADGSHAGLLNKASYKVYVGNEGSSDYETNTVTVKPNEPEIEKYVNQAVHKDITLDEVFTYDLIAWVTSDADTVTITDELMGDLVFASDADAVKVEALGADNNHKVVNNVNGTSAGNGDATVAAAGTAVDGAKVAISGQKLTVTIADASAVRGQWVRVTFDAKIADGKTLADVKAHYASIDATAAGNRAEPNVGNAPVLSDENHDGLPNTASYEIGVKQAVLDENGNPRVDEDGNFIEEIKPKYSDESNTVTVKPAESVKHEVIISKQELGESTDELPGAHIKVTDSEGNVVDEWTSTTEPHVLKLEAGEYTLEEVNAPEGFEAITTTIRFTVGEDGTVTVLNAEEVTNGQVSVQDVNHLILEDLRQVVSVTVTKEWLNANNWAVAAPALWPAGAEVTVSIKDGDTVVKTIVLTADNPSETVTGLPKLVGREYTVEEAEVVGVYALEGEPEVTVDEDGNVTAKLTNRLLPARSELAIMVAKVDEKGEALSGAELEVTGVDLNGNPIDLGADAVWTTDGTDHRVPHIVPGKYTLTEKKAPSGYKIAAPINFEVTLEGTVLVDGKLVNTLVITMTDELDRPGAPKTVEPTSPTHSPTNTAPGVDVKPGPSPVVRPLVRTGSPAGLAVLAAVVLLGTGAGILLNRRRTEQ